MLYKSEPLINYFSYNIGVKLGVLKVRSNIPYKYNCGICRTSHLVGAPTTISDVFFSNVSFRFPPNLLISDLQDSNIKRNVNQTITK